MRYKKATQIKRIKAKLEKLGIAGDLIDIEKLVDGSLSLRKNTQLIMQELKIEEQLTNKKAEKIALEEFKTEQFQKYETELKDKMLLDLEQIKASDSPELEKIFHLPIFWVKLVAQGFRNGLILEGEYGVAKTTIVLQTLQKLGVDFAYRKGHVTPYAFAKYLFENKDKAIIVIDDTDELIKNKITKETLKGLLDNKLRSVTWDSTKNTDIPSSFDISAKLIIIGNEFPTDINFESVKDRIFYWKISLTYSEKIRAMHEIVKLPYKDMELAERKAVLDYIIKHSSSATANFSLRTLEKLYDIYLYCKANNLIASDYFKEMLVEDERLRLIQDLMLKEIPEISRIRQFTTDIGQSRATYYRLRQKLSQNLIVD